MTLAFDATSWALHNRMKEISADFMHHGLTSISMQEGASDVYGSQLRHNDPSC